MQAGDLAKSLKGHDTDRVYLVIAVLNSDFVLVCDGKYRKKDNPKQKRIKHLKVIGEKIEFSLEELKDSDIRRFCKSI